MINNITLAVFLRACRYAGIIFALTATMSAITPLHAQTADATASASARLAKVLPPDVAQRIMARIAAAHQQGLPTNSLEQRALKFAAKGVNPASIETSIDEQANRMARANEALKSARGSKPSSDEIDAGAEAMRKGVDAVKVQDLAKSAPSGRSVAVPLYVVGSLIDRGLSADDALRRVRDRLLARADDAALERLPSELPPEAVAGKSNRPDDPGRGVGPSKRPTGAGAGGGMGSGGGKGVGGPPPGVPANPGRGKGDKPATPANPRP